MSAKAIVITKLLATAGVTAIVGQTIRPVAFKQSDLPPAILVTTEGIADTTTLGGAGKYYRSRVMTECIGTTATEAEAIGDAVIEALNGVIYETIAGCEVSAILLGTTDTDDYNEDLTQFRRTLDFFVRWRAA